MKLPLSASPENRIIPQSKGEGKRAVAGTSIFFPTWPSDKAASFKIKKE
jgi:hypothetical protein